MTWLPLAILVAPLAVAALLLFTGRRLPRGGDWLAIIVMAACFAGSIGVYRAVMTPSETEQAVSSPTTTTAHDDFAAPPEARELFGPSVAWITVPTTTSETANHQPRTATHSFAFGTYIDPLGAIMLMIVTGLALAVMIYTTWYLHGDALYPRFWWTFSFFCFAMIGVVISANLLMTFVFWELVGLGSYFLIGFWFHKPTVDKDPHYQHMKASYATGVIESKLSPADAQLKAFVMNRIGDAGFIAGLAICAWAVSAWATKGGFDLPDLLSWDILFRAVHEGAFDGISLCGMSGGTLLTIAGIGIFCGAIGKSAQFPLHTWLADAMQGPTTGSAIIHAATMVAAGVFLVARVYPLLTPDALLVISVVGGVTCFLAATIACVQWDLKAVLAYSTVSQLGYMMLGLGAGLLTGGYNAGVAHLFTHAIFKCLLFLGAAAIIHGCHEQQDLNKLGGLAKKMPVTALVTGLAVLAILGAPLFSAFYSKDGILAASWLASASRGANTHGAHWLLAWLPFWLGAATALLTSYYMTRWWVRIFLGTPGDHHVVDHAHDPWLRGRIVLVILALGCFQIVWTHHLDPFTAHAWLDEVILPKTEGLYATMPALNEAQLEHTRHAYHVKAMTLATWFLALGASLAVAVWWLMPRLGRNLAGELRAVWPMSWWWTLTSKLWGIEWFYDRLTAVFGKGLGSVAAAADLGTAKRLSELEGKPDGQPTCPLGLPSLDGGIDLIGRTASGFGKLSSAFNTGRIGTYLGLTALAVALVLLLLV